MRKQFDQPRTLAPNLLELRRGKSGKRFTRDALGLKLKVWRLTTVTAAIRKPEAESNLQHPSDHEHPQRLSVWRSALRSDRPNQPTKSLRASVSSDRSAQSSGRVG
jgi:hypothetical protein